MKHNIIFLFSLAGLAIAQPTQYANTKGSNITDKATFRNNIGTTEAGNSFVTAGTPERQSFLRINSNGSGQYRNEEQLRSDIKAAESPFSEILNSGKAIYSDSDSANKKTWSIITGSGTTEGNGDFNRLTMSTVGPTVSAFRTLVSFDGNNTGVAVRVRRNSVNELIQIRLNYGTATNPKQASTGLISSGSFIPGKWSLHAMPFSDFTLAAGTTIADLRNVWAVDLLVRPASGVGDFLDVRELMIFKSEGVGKVCWEFDDGRLDTYTVAAPILQANGYRGSIAVDYSRIGTANYMTISNINDLYNNRGWAMMGHDAVGFTGLSENDQITKHKAAKEYLVSNGWLKGSDHWIWPGGSTNLVSDNIASRFWKSRRQVAFTSFYIRPGVFEPSAPSLRYMTRTTPVADIKALMDKAKLNGDTLVLAFHSIVTPSVASEDYTIADFTDLVQYASSIGLVDATYDEVFKASPDPVKAPIPSGLDALETKAEKSEVVDLNPIWGGYRIRALGAHQFGSNGTGASAAEGFLSGGAGLTSGTANSGYGRTTVYRGVTSNTSVTGAGINFSRPITVSALLGVGVNVASGNCFRFVVGGNRGVPAAADSNALTTRGFGWEIGWDSANSRTAVRTFAHNGTSYTTSAWHFSGLQSNDMIYAVISSDGAGNISLYFTNGLNAAPKPPSSPTLTQTGGPIIQTGASDGVDIVASNSSSGTTSASIVFFNGHIDSR